MESGIPKIREIIEQSTELCDAGNSAQAIEILNDALRVVSDSALYAARGLAFERARDFDRAIQDYSTAVRLEPFQALIRLNRGRVLMKQRRFVEAIDDFDRAIELSPQNARAHRLRAFCHEQLDRIDDAIAGYKRAIELAPTYALAHHNLGLIWLVRGQWTLAIEHLDAAYMLKPSDATPLITRSEAHSALGIFPLAMSDLQAAIRQHPNNWLATARLAWLLSTCPDPSFRDGAQAIELATRACNMTGWKNATALEALAAAYAETGDFNQAQRWQSAVIEQLPEAERVDATEVYNEFVKHSPIRQWVE